MSPDRGFRSLSRPHGVGAAAPCGFSAAVVTVRRQRVTEFCFRSDGRSGFRHGSPCSRPESILFRPGCPREIPAKAPACAPPRGSGRSVGSRRWPARFECRSHPRGLPVGAPGSGGWQDVHCRGAGVRLGRMPTGQGPRLRRRSCTRRSPSVRFPSTQKCRGQRRRPIEAGRIDTVRREEFVSPGF